MLKRGYGNNIEAVSKVWRHCEWSASGMRQSIE